jgi:hypothetical protein
MDVVTGGTDFLDSNKYILHKINEFVSNIMHYANINNNQEHYSNCITGSENKLNHCKQMYKKRKNFILLLQEVPYYSH